ncbi:ribonuclease H-like domain-containing protein [Tanacetum coccineum]|uniref:Ribonuclease H-like domain-containing protein n=1 Tax=Tanacetum coccineum TaxID=301880 RepID=A0ABQ5H3G7_9ASTR
MDDVQKIAEVDDDQEAVKIKELIEIVLDEEEVAIDAIPLATKSPSIDVIKNGNSFKPTATTTTNADGSSTTLILGPVTADEKSQKKNDVKARSILLMALPNEHLLTFNQYKDAKTFFAAIQTRFGGNYATKKTHKTLLKQIYKNFSALSTESLDYIFNRLQKIVSQLAILGENISQEDLNLKFLRSLPSEWNTHVVVWRNKPDLDTMSFDDLYNNFKIVEQEVKGTASSSLSSQNLAFMSSTSSTNEVNTAYGVSTANTQVSTASTQVSTANLNDLEEMDLKWLLALLSMRIRKFFQKTSRKITINGSDTVRYDKSKVECFNCHKLGHFARECRGPRNQDNKSRNQDSSRRTINVEEISSKAMLAIDEAGFDWSFIADAEVPTDMALMAFSDSKSGLEEFQQPEFEGYGPKTSKSVSEDTFNEVRESPDASLVEELMSNDKLEKKTVFPTVAKINFARPQQQEKPIRKPANCNYHQRERMVSGNNYTRVNYNYSVKKAHPSAYKNIVPRAVLMKTGLRPLNNARPVNTAHPKTTVYSARPMSCFSKSAQSTVKRPYQIKTALTNKKYSQKVNTAKGSFYTARPKAVNTARQNLAVVNAIRANQVNAVKASTCWVWRPTKLNSASITFKRHNYVDARGRSKSVMAWISKNLMEDILHLGDELKEEEILVKELLKLTKHIEIRHHFIRDSNEKKLIQMIKIHTNHNVADLLTKAFDVGRFQYPIATANDVIQVSIVGLPYYWLKAGYTLLYSLNSKAFRVYNIRTWESRKNLHVRFLEDKPIIAGARPKWLFDIDVLTESMNYVPVVARTNSNVSPGTKESIGASHSSKVTASCQDCILMPLNKNDDSEIDNQERHEKSAQDVNTVGPSINTASINDNTGIPTVNTTLTEETCCFLG